MRAAILRFEPIGGGTDGTRFTTTLTDAVISNRDDPDTVEQLEALELGDEIVLGGGAAATWRIKRLA